ncbi:DNA/RNA non-specific endonuclease [Ulvibacterium sp.]|uniref:DNA/RNA non-specific endonuclease n=1 Tax=Ulvibacterium sp. TaxID=2665914 RepID=UPI003BA8C9B4
MSYTNNFLGDSFKVELPTLAATNESVLIHYTHFSTCFFKPRKFALYCACNIPTLDKRINIKRPSSKFFRKDEDNLELEYQIGQDFYYCIENDHPTVDNRNLLDRGHIIRREYPQWKNEEIATKASRETFYFTNIAPQYYSLNQGDWQELEDYVIDEVKNRVSVFSGCIFDDKDPVALYKGAETRKVQGFVIPLKFWKIVYYMKDSKLHRIGFVLSQEKVVKDLDFVFSPNEKIKLLFSTKDPFAHLDEDLVPYIVDVSAIEFSTGLSFTPAMEKIKGQKPKTYLFDQDNRADSVKFSKNILTNYL